jgi:succinate dehydrogenase/fumarate reductase flavoprotein subunit
VAVDDNWQSSVKGLYAVGEAAGTFGMYRPGGSALNSAQVGSMRAAQHIAGKGKMGAEVTALAFNAVRAAEAPEGVCYAALLKENRHRMSLYAAYERDPVQMQCLYDDLKGQWMDYQKNGAGIKQGGLPGFYKYIDLLVTQMNVLSAMLLAAEVFGGRGGAMVTGAQVSTVRNRMVTTLGGPAVSKVEDVRPLQLPDDWFEKVWNRAD